MLELLLELGCEELPAAFVQKAYEDLERNIMGKLKEQRLLGDSAHSSSLGTPRRLIVSIQGVLPRQEDWSEEMRGPSLKAAFDESGNPTQALLGFCNKNGADPNTVRKDDQYVWVTKSVKGQSALDLLQTSLPSAIRELAFEKSMRWGASRMRFARPIRWIVAKLGADVVEFEIEGVRSSDQSRGHRFYDPKPFAVTTSQELEESLRARKVEIDPAKRKSMILEGAANVAEGTPEMAEALVDENVFLTEWPTPVAGRFRPEFLALPEAVLVTAMAKHEKMFPVRGAQAKLTNQFVFVRNSGEDDTVRAGNEWVLNARFNDAKFFFELDQRADMDGFLERTQTIVFQEKLGTVRERANRLQSLAEAISGQTGASQNEKDWAKAAALYCKADLSTGLVSEFAALQGVIGGEYARREGKLSAESCWAIESHYDISKNLDSATPASRTALRVLIADQLDKLAGYLGLGLKPTGSADPYGLRRAATLLIESAWRWESGFPGVGYVDLLDKAAELYQIELPKKGEIQASLEEIFRLRYEALLAEERKDVLDAALTDQVLNPRAIRFKVSALNLARKDQNFVQSATRPLNILQAARKKGFTYATSADIEHSEPTAKALQQAIATRKPAVEAAVAKEDAQALMAALTPLAEPINAFFDSTMVMSEDAAARTANLSLVNGAAELLKTAGDFSALVFEG